MQTVTIVTLTLTVIFVMSMSSGSAFAQQDFTLNFNGFSPDAPVMFKVQQFFAGVSESLTFDQDKKAELKLKHAQDIQDQIDELDRVNKVIPAEFEEKRLEKIQQAQTILSNEPMANVDREPMQDIINKLTTVSELNQIRILWGQFPNVISADDATKADFNKRVNALKSWDNNCSGSFDVDDYRMTNESFEKLAQKCPAVQDYSQNKIRHLISGNV